MKKKNSRGKNTIGLWQRPVPKRTSESCREKGSAAAGFKNVPLETFYTIAERVMARRNIALTDVDRDIYKAIYNISDRYK